MANRANEIVLGAADGAGCHARPRVKTPAQSIANRIVLGVAARSVHAVRSGEGVPSGRSGVDFSVAPREARGVNKAELERRTKCFAIAIIRALPRIEPREVRYALGKQLLRSAGSIGANYREANRAESLADFVHKLSIVEKEASETTYWLEVIDESGSLDPRHAEPLREESDQLLRIFSRACITARRRLQSEKSSRGVAG